MTKADGVKIKAPLDSPLSVDDTSQRLVAKLSVSVRKASSAPSPFKLRTITSRLSGPQSDLRSAHPIGGHFDHSRGCKVGESATQRSLG